MKVGVLQLNALSSSRKMYHCSQATLDGQGLIKESQKALVQFFVFFRVISRDGQRKLVIMGVSNWVNQVEIKRHAGKIMALRCSKFYT